MLVEGRRVPRTEWGLDGIVRFVAGFNRPSLCWTLSTRTSAPWPSVNDGWIGSAAPSTKWRWRTCVPRGRWTPTRRYATSREAIPLSSSTRSCCGRRARKSSVGATTTRSPAGPGPGATTEPSTGRYQNTTSPVRFFLRYPSSKPTEWKPNPVKNWEQFSYEYFDVIVWSEFSLQGEYLELPPPIFLKLKYSLWKDTQAQNLLPDCIFSTLKTALKIERKI